MQHITHIFIGNDLVSFRDKFAAMYRKHHPNHEESTFSAISIIENAEGQYILTPDENGNSLDSITIDANNRQNTLFNYFEDCYHRKVTVAHPGNKSMVVILWAKLYLDDSYNIIKELTESITLCTSNFHIEVSGFTHDAVTCFITNPLERLSPDFYKRNFENNIKRLRLHRDALSSLRLITNRNMENLALDLDETAMARLCSEHASLMCDYFLSIHPVVIDKNETPFESFGISSILFDLEYYQTFIRNKIIIDKMIGQGIDKRIFNINALAQKTNPILKQVIEEIHQFKNTQATDAKAALALKDVATASNIVGSIDEPVKGIIQSLSDKINKLLSSGQISIFESEVLLSLILGEDSSMFDSSSVDAEEKIIDDIINEAASFFIQLDEENVKFKNVSLDDIKRIRKCMRNIAVANRQRENRIKALNIQINNEITEEKRLSIDGYNFGGTKYKVNLNIDKNPLEQSYEPHNVYLDNIDLSDSFAPIRNQGKQGSCASFAVSSVIEVLRNDKKRYSPAFLYWTARENCKTTDSDSGASLYEVINGAIQKGICSEKSMPYNPENYSLAPSEVATKEALDCMVIEAKTVNTDLNDIKSALVDGFPVIIATKIFDSFSNTRGGFVRHPSSKEIAREANSDGHGNHAMVVCGYSDKERIFFVRNSWGKDFGQDGYCYIPYSYAKQYFLQACIITKVTTQESNSSIELKKTINFNIIDSNIETAILQNLIEEDNFELQILAEKSSKLRSDWSHNIAILGNVNNTADIINESKEVINKEIQYKIETLSKLEDSEPGKVKDFKRNYFKELITSGFLVILAWCLVSFFSYETFLWIIAGIVTTIFLGIFGAYSYKWRRYRQDLRDEIQQQANQINSLEIRKFNLDVNAHIYGTILQKTEEYRLNLLSQYQDLKKFNNAWLKYYENIQKEQTEITPMVQYPFLSILENNLLERYYSLRKDIMLQSLDLHIIYDEFSTSKDLTYIIKNSTNLNSAILRGLRNFSMKDVIIHQDTNNWQFIPDASTIAEILPILDSRAIPFCPYNNPTDPSLEKYIFIKDITPNEMSTISRYFTQPPISINCSNPYSICELNIVRYNIP